MTAPLLEVRDLTTCFPSPRGSFLAIDGLSLSLPRGGAIGIVGESGCGKTTLALSVMRLVPEPGKITGGQILYDGRDLLALSQTEMRSLRGRRLAMIFQEPLSSLNPVLTIGDQIGEAIRLHQKVGRAEARRRSIEALRAVELASPEHHVDSYPHQLSGGMRQRAMIAMALSCGADLLLADEPTTALDGTLEAQILELLGRLRRECNMALLLITHDLGVASQTCEQILVMYAGAVVEEASAASIFRCPAHPYTAALRDAMPTGARDPSGRRERLRAIPGSAPGPSSSAVQGCAFAPRCARAIDSCRSERPALLPRGEGRRVACIRPLADPERVPP
jgi:peptide/nickel transport system ATP-binding protein